MCKSYIQRVGNLWRGALVSQLATSVRIAEMEVGTVGLDVLQRGFQQRIAERAAESD